MKNEKSYSYIYFAINPLSGKILVFKLWDKMLAANLIARFFNRDSNAIVFFHQTIALQKL